MAEKKAAKPAEPAKPAASGGGNESNLLAAIGYIIGILAIIMYLIKKEDKYLRFHSMQSILLWVGAIVVFVVLGIGTSILSMVPVVNVLACATGILSMVLWLVVVVAALYAAYKAFNGEEYEIPYVGPMARKYV